MIIPNHKELKKGLEHALRKILEVPLESQITFSFMVRYYRIKRDLTQKEAATKMGFDTLYSYQRLEWSQ